jgi:hypothetical protein
MKKLSVIAASLVAAVVLCAAPISLHLSQDKGLTLSVDKARARVGRPLTPGSIAGVHRRHHRRNAYYNHGNYYNYRYHGNYYNYRYHGGYYRYRNHGNYYNHRVYRRHHYRYW